MEQQLEIMWDQPTDLAEPKTPSKGIQRLQSSPVAQKHEGKAMTPEETSKGQAPLIPLDQVELLDPVEFIGQVEFMDQVDLIQSVATLLDESSVVEQAIAQGREQPSEQQRIKQLEQALYQCQLYIDELKQKLIDQDFLEEQLAATESFSHIQKQAIETLKNQVSDQQPLQLELEGLKQDMQSIKNQCMEAEAIAQQRDNECSVLKLQLLQANSELDRLKDKNAQVMAQLESLQSSMVQETQQRIIAQKTAERLRTEQNNRDLTTRSLESKLQQSEEMLINREEMITALKNRNQPDSQKDQFIQGLSTTLLKAQRQITDLETELSNQSILQAQLQHTTHELEQDTKVSQVRSEQLEHQVNDLQEQVLRQAQQASEYETAIQHWKTRSLEAEEWAAQVAKLWDSLDSDPLMDMTSPDLTKVLTALSLWFKGSRGHLSQDEAALLSPRELLGMRPRWQNF